MKNIIDESKRRTLDRPLTGIIQNDRIWEQWYDKDVFNEKLPKMSQKDYLFECIGDEPERIIINNRGKMKFSVNDFKKMIEKYEKAFFVSGLQKGDVICTIGLTTPEMYAIKYAATSLGAITCNLNILDIGVDDEGKNRLYKQLESVNPRMIFTLDILEDKIYKVINDDKFSKVMKVSMPLEYSTPKLNPERLVISLKIIKDFLSGKKVNGKISLNEFLNLGKDISFENIEESYSEKQPCNISFTSGTTGINKAVLLSHDANNSLAFQQIKAEFGYKRGTKQLALVPPFLAFWDSDIVHSVLCLGGQNILELSLDYNKIPEYFKKYDVNLGIWSQYLWSSLLTLPKRDLERISKLLKVAIIGGERCEINAAETFYNKTGIIQTTGYGASEVNTTFSVTHPSCNKIGSCGLPLPFNNVKIVNDSFEDVTYNVPGRLLITGPSLMNGYYKRDDLTKQALYTDENNVTWYNTGDYAVLDDDGCLTVLDRYVKPVEINTNGIIEKVNLVDIVEKVKKNRNVKNCKATFNNDKIILHLSLDDFTGLLKDDAINSIIDTIKSNLPESQWPYIINLADELPRTAVGKVDYKEIKKIGEELCEKYDLSEKLKVIELNQKILEKRK